MHEVEARKAGNNNMRSNGYDEKDKNSTNIYATLTLGHQGQRYWNKFRQ